MGIPLFLLFFLNFVVTIVVLFYQEVFLHVSAHFAIICCVAVTLFFMEKVKEKLPFCFIGVVFGGICGVLLNLSQGQWRKLGELALFVLNMVFPGATWLKIFKAWLERLPVISSGELNMEVSVLITFVNIVLGCFFMWAIIRLIELKGKGISESILTLAFINTLAAGRLYFPWPPLLWGTLIYLGGAIIVGWMCKERTVKKEELSWVAFLGNLPWWLIGIGLGYRILVNPQELIEKAKILNLGVATIPVAVVISLLILALWALLNSFVQWLILRSIHGSLSTAPKEQED